MVIVKAKDEDIEAILSLQTQIYRVEEIAPNAAETLKNQLQNAEYDVLVVKKDNKVAGTATIYYIQVAAHGKPYALLEGLVVTKNQREHGIGTKLFTRCVEIAQKKGCYKMIFTSGSDRREAHQFYEKLGFKKWGLEFRKDL